MIKIKIFLISIVCLCSTTFALADTLQMVDGRMVTGEILSENDYQVVIRDEKGKVATFYREQIANVIKGEYVEPLSINTSEFESIPSDKAELIIRLIEANGMRASLDKNIQATLNSFPESRKESMSKLFNINEIISELVPVYDRHFTKDELTALVQFYESPTGQKTVEVSPTLVQEAAEASLDYFHKKLTPNN